jgi:septin family protein
MPFAVIGSSDLVKIGTRLVKGRSYKWGTVIGEDKILLNYNYLNFNIFSFNQ